MDASPLFESKLTGLELVHRGKVRDNYAIDDGRLLIVATDRLSAFDVVMQDPIPGKGRVLTAISDFWFGRTRRIVSNHLTGEPLSRYVGNPGELAMLEGRAVIVERLNAIARRGRGTRLSRGLGLEGLPEERQGLRHQAARRARAGRQAAGADIHAGDQGAGRRA